MSSGSVIEGMVLAMQPMHEKQTMPEDNGIPEEYLEPTTLTRREKGQNGRQKPFHDSGVVDMDTDEFVGQPGGMTSGQGMRGYSGQPRWSGQSSSPSSPVSPTGSSRPPSYKSNAPVPPSSSPVEDYTAPTPYNEYEELPNLRYNNPNYKYHEVSGVVPETRRPSPGTSSHLGPMNRSTENLCQMNNSIHDKPQPPSFRRRQNPLYEEKEHEDSKKGTAATVVSETCVLCLLFIVGVLALAALILVILDLSGVIGRKSYSPEGSAISQDNITDVTVMARRLQDLERRYSKLEKFVKDLNRSTHLKNIVFQNFSDQNQAQNFAALEALLSQHGLNLTKIENRMQQFSSDMMTFNTSVKQQLSEIQKMPGPQGPPGPRGLKGNPGAGNLTRCRYRDLSRGSNVNSPSTTTQWAPDASELRDWVIMGLECSTQGGASAMLQVQDHPNSSSDSQFMCKCTGADSTATISRYCYLHIFECPRIS